MLNDETDKKSFDDKTMVLGPATLERDATACRASLVVLSGWEIGREIALNGKEHLFGRGLTAHTRIASPSVSREHAKIVVSSDCSSPVFTLIDLQSSNGTRVNNVPVTVTILKNGDRVLMGEVLFKFILQDDLDLRFYQDVHRLINYDQLTGLLTMDAFRGRLDACMQRSEPDGPFTLAMTDLDGLKRVNDTHGHLAGRMVVRTMGSIIRASLRPGDFGGLYGGDEAVLLFPETNETDAREVAENLRRSIEERVFEHQGKEFQVTISQGLAEWPRDGRSADHIIAAADAALYRAKAAGRNRVCLSRE